MTSTMTSIFNSAKFDLLNRCRDIAISVVMAFITALNEDLTDTDLLILFPKIPEPISSSTVSHMDANPEKKEKEKESDEKKEKKEKEAAEKKEKKAAEKKEKKEKEAAEKKEKKVAEKKEQREKEAAEKKEKKKKEAGEKEKKVAAPLDQLRNWEHGVFYDAVEDIDDDDQYITNTIQLFTGPRKIKLEKANEICA